MDYSALAAEAREYLPFMQANRQKFHQIPEVGLHLPLTQKAVLEAIECLGEITLGKDLSSITLLIRGAKPGPTVLIRADMDALPVIEDSGESFASTNGAMHACGHDLHMAIGIGAAHLVHTHRDELAGNVLFWFQPGEEGQGGADVMLAENSHLVDGVKPIAAYGVHVFAMYQSGAFGTKRGALMASAGEFTATIKGKGGHGSMPWLSQDPISVMAEMISGLQTAITKQLSPLDPTIVNVCWVKAGTVGASNVTPSEASFGATVRTFSDEHFDKVRHLIPRFLAGTAAAYGVEVDVAFDGVYAPATKVLINDDDAVARVEKVAPQVLGPGRYINLKDPTPGGEDFASVLKEIPGAFVFVGACPQELDPTTAPNNHSAQVRFDETVMPDASALLASLAFDTLDEAAGA
jgi:hippurate hydrolase